MSTMFETMTDRFGRYWAPPSWRNMLITLPYAIGLVFMLCSFALDHQIAGREQITYGNIDTHEPANHSRYGYAFLVNGKRDTGWQIPLSEFRIWQQIRVYYDLLDPTKNSLNSFSESRNEILGPSLFCVFGIAGIALIICFLRREHEQNSRIRNPNP